MKYLMIKVLLPEDTPGCIRKRIRKFARNVSCDSGAVVESAYSQGKVVYIFSPGNCGADMSALVVNSDCKEICSLGGFKGNLVCDGDTLYKEATNNRVIWRN